MRSTSFHRRVTRSDPAGWLFTYPELASRLELQAELANNWRLRHCLFSGLNCLLQIARIPDTKIATRVLTVFHEQQQVRLQPYCQELEARDFRLHNQLMGFYRNVVFNILVGLGRSDKITHRQNWVVVDRSIKPRPRA